MHRRARSEKVAATITGTTTTRSYEKEKNLTSNYNRGATSIILCNKILKFYEFIKGRWNIHKNKRVIIRNIRLTYGKALRERGVILSGKKPTQATQMMIFKAQERRTAGAASETHIAAIPEKGSGLYNEGVEVWRKVSSQKKKDRRKI